MPKVGTIEFSESGKIIDSIHGKTMGAVGLDLYYSLKKNNFYFKADEIEEKLGGKIKSWNNIPELFKNCNDKDEACVIISRLFNPKGEVKKHLVIKVEVSVYSQQDMEDGFKLKELAKKIINNGYSGFSTDKEKRGIVLGYKRYVSITNTFGTVYSECEDFQYKIGDSWSYSDRNFKSTPPDGLIDWTQEREDFLMATREQLNMMSKNLIQFFNVEEKDIDKIMISSNRLLETKEENNESK